MNNSIEKQIIQNYEQEEKMMILIYAQWCINNDFDPIELYKKAYPNQSQNVALEEAIQKTVSKNDADDIPDEIVLNVLQLFGNDDLAFIIQKEIEQRKK